MIKRSGSAEIYLRFAIAMPILRINMTRSRYSRSECPTDGTPDVAGLQAVLSKLVALPASALPPSYHAADSLPAWKQSLARLPPLPLGTCHYGGGNGEGCRTCAPNPHFNSSSCWCNGHWPCTPPNATERVVVRSERGPPPLGPGGEARPSLPPALLRASARPAAELRRSTP